MENKNFIVKLCHQQANKILLVALPFSGATAQSFNRWKPYIPNNIDFSALQYPGRGHLINETLLLDLEQLLSLLYEPLLNTLKSHAYVIWYGHSFGGLVAYELLKKYSVNNINLSAMKLVIGACPSPDLIGKKNHLHVLPDDEFWMEIGQYGGTPEEIIKSERLKDFFLPILKADFTMYENYKFEDKQSMLNVPLLTIGGRSDNIVKYHELTGWRKLTTKIYQQRCVKGNHFFLNHNIATLINKILGLNNLTELSLTDFSIR